MSWAAMSDQHRRLAFCTLGMFIIDEIEYIDGRAPAARIMGGAGAFAALGARLAAGAANSREVSWIVDMGIDFPPEFVALIDSWRTSCWFRQDLTRRTTAAWNGYGPAEYRAFKYLTPKLRLDSHSLSEAQVLCRSFHMVCSPSRCIDIIHGIMGRRQALGDADPPPIFVWEPVPDLCTPDELDGMREAARLVDVVSPNAEELAAFFNGGPEDESLSREKMVDRLLGTPAGELLDTALVVREGALGCTAYQGSRSLHLPAVHQAGRGVVDPTGGGNAFLGALALAMTGRASPPPATVWATLDLQRPNAAGQALLFGLLHATVAASYVIEQAGMPTVSLTNADLWNGGAYQDRFLSYVAREREDIRRQVLEQRSWYT